MAGTPRTCRRTRPGARVARMLATAAIAVGSLLQSGCGTVRTVDNLHVGSPRIYGGTRLDLAAVNDDRMVLERFRSHSITPPAHPAADLPLSVVGDTVLLPFMVWYTITEPVVGRP